MAAFPRRAGVLDKFELRASHNETSSCESLNRKTKQVVAEKARPRCRRSSPRSRTLTTARRLVGQPQAWRQ